MMPHVPKRQRLLVITAGAGLALLILDRVLLTPLGHLWEEHAAEIASLQGRVTNGRSVIARAAHTERVWADIQASALPRDQAQCEHDVISAFEAWGASSGVELGSIKPVWKTGVSRDSSLLECRLDASGSLGALSRFLYELGRSPLALRAESVELIARDDTGDRLTLSLVVTGLRLIPLEGKR